MDTPRQARVRINRLERYFRRHAERYRPEDRLTLRALFEHAHTPQHVAALAEALRAWQTPGDHPTAGAASERPSQPAAPAPPPPR